MDHRPSRWTDWGRRSFLTILFASLFLGLIFDRSARGGLRLALFPAALSLFDPYVWESLRNSLTVAVLTALVAVFFGVPIGWVLARRRPVAGCVLHAVFAALSVVPPLCLVVGLAFLGPGVESTLERFAGRIGWGLGGRGIQLLWAESCWAGAWMVGITVSGLRRIDPAWEDAARLAGATSRQIASRLIWPRIRAGVYRAAGLIVLAVLFEPSGPLILEMRRTLAFQIVDAASSVNGGTACAVLTALGVCVALAVQGVLRLLGGPVMSEASFGTSRYLVSVPLIQRLLVLPPLLLALLLGWMPIGVLLHRLTVPAALGADDLRAILAATPWWKSIAWTLGLAGIATVAARLTFGAWSRLVGGEGGRRGVRAMLPGDGLPPSFLCALIVLMVARLVGLSVGSGGGILEVEALPFREIRVSWRAVGFEPWLLAASLWLTMILSVVQWPLSWRVGPRIQASGDQGSPEDGVTPKATRSRAWREDFAFCATLAGPALLYASSGYSIASLLVLAVSESSVTRRTACFCLLFAAFSIAFRARRDAAGWFAVEGDARDAEPARGTAAAPN